MLKNSLRGTNRAAIIIITLIALSHSAFVLGCGDDSRSQNTSPPAASILVNGRQITPAGTTSGQVGGMPLNIIISPDGKYAITSSSCINALLSTVRVSDGAVISSLAFPAADPSIPNAGLFYGLAFDPTPHNGAYTLYASQGVFGCVAVLSLAGDGTLTQTGNIPSSSSRPNPYEPHDQPAGIAFANGNIFMANYFSVTLGAPWQPASTLSIYPASGSDTALGRYTFMDTG